MAKEVIVNGVRYLICKNKKGKKVKVRIPDPPKMEIRREDGPFAIIAWALVPIGIFLFIAVIVEITMVVGNILKGGL